jgi:sn-glycerol 3-phosphate transport system permease protein
VRAEALVAPGIRSRRGARPSAGWLAAALLAPSLAFLLVFTYWPLLVSIAGSFQRGSPTGASARWVGVQNYRDLWQDAPFRSPAPR